MEKVLLPDLPSTLPYGKSIWEFPSPVVSPWKNVSGTGLWPSEFHQQGKESSILSIIPGHRAHRQEVLSDRSTFAENLFHVVFWTALNTKGISAGDSRCYLICIEDSNEVYQSNEAFRWNAQHQCNLLQEFSLFIGQTCKPPLKKSDKWCKLSSSCLTMKASYYLKTLTAIW